LLQLQESARARIGLSRAACCRSYAHIWRLLEGAFPVVFVEVEDAIPSDLDGLVVAGSDIESFSPSDQNCPWIVYTWHADLAPTSPDTGYGIFRFTADPFLDRPWHLAELHCSETPGHSAAVESEVGPGDDVLVRRDGELYWIVNRDARFTIERVFAALPVLGDQEILRDRFKLGRFSRFLPLLHFLKQAVVSRGWRYPPMRASFLFDDPNLHHVRYGYLDYRRLAEQGIQHRFSTAIATVPQDLWYSNGQVLAMFRRFGDQLSLLMHGNDHLREELAMPIPKTEKLRIVAQAWRRVDAFEKRRSVLVSRVMAPPHGSCDLGSLIAMRRCGYRAACISRPYPFLAIPPRDRKLATWFPADLVAGGLPVCSRYSIAKPEDELRFRAWLGQAVIVYGHHYDLADGYSRLLRLAEMINSWGTVKWGAIDTIIEENYISMVSGQSLTVLLYCLRTRVKIPESVVYVNVVVPYVDGLVERTKILALANNETQLVDVDSQGVAEKPIETSPGTVIDVRIVFPDLVDCYGISAPRRRVWPFVRRILTTARDRVSVLVGKHKGIQR